MCKENLLTKFTNDEFGEIRVLTIDEEPMFLGKELVEKLGYKIDGTTSYSKYVKQYCDKEDYMKMNNSGLELFGISDSGRKGEYLVNESGMYSLILESDLPSAKNFKRWVTKEVLPSIRKHGAYVGENADENYINNEVRFGNKTTIKTFANADPAMVNQLYSEFKEYIDNEYKNNTDVRKSRYSSVDKGLTRLLENMGTNVNNIGLCYNVQVLRREVLSDIKTLGNRINGGKRAGLTRQNKKLKNELDEANNNILNKEKELLDIKEKYDPNGFWTNLDYHPFSVNYMYKNNQITPEYQRWIDNFPKQKLHSKEEYERRLNIDFSKPIVIYIKYRNLAKFDLDNLSKSLIDYIFNRHFLVDDSIVKGKVEFVKEHCDSYADGKIKFTLRNMTDDEINRLND